MTSALRRWFPLSMLVVGLLLAFDAMNAAQAQVVAIGASNTAGTGPTGGGVMPSEAYPALIEKALRARGLNVTVKNAGHAGITAGAALASLNSEVDSGTKVVIIDPAWNERRLGGTAVDERRNIDEMSRRLKARGIKVITFQSWPRFYSGGGGGHPSDKAHAILAAQLLPQVMAGLRR